jgi:hypothetical protein
MRALPPEMSMPTLVFDFIRRKLDPSLQQLPLSLDDCPWVLIAILVRQHASSLVVASATSGLLQRYDYSLARHGVKSTVSNCKDSH